MKKTSKVMNWLFQLLKHKESIMATQSEVETEFKFQLQNDSPQRLQQAGDGWQQLPLGFYYGNTPHSEIAVDIAIRATMLRILQKDHATLPPQIMPALAAMINTNTLVAGAITAMTIATAHEIPLG
jgi:hypothetical protein